uniref:Uncharacterized protein n=1 Tax=Glossina pallidipes TaxID=7398 RepID=A0A1B0AF21_GLOPL
MKYERCGSACEFDDVNLTTAAGFSIQFLVVIFVNVLLRLANKCLRPISIAVSAGVTVVQLGVHIESINSVYIKRSLHSEMIVFNNVKYKVINFVVLKRQRDGHLTRVFNNKLPDVRRIPILAESVWVKHQNLRECLCKGLHQNLIEFPPLGQQSFDCSTPFDHKATKSQYKMIL